jgi:aspartate racemase
MGSASPDKKKVIGVLGGMGPEATAYFFRLLIASTAAAKDQDHAPVLIWSNPHIPPRSDAILHGGPSPLPALLQGLALLEQGGAELVVMPCLTAHHYIRELTAAASVPFVNLIEESLRFARGGIPGLRRIGLLASSGTVQAGLFRKPFEKRGIEILAPDPRSQDSVMGAILEIKAGRIAGRPRAAIVRAARKLIARGAEAVIAGCTEVPLALRQGDIEVPLIEPMAVGARACIRKAGWRAADGAASPGHD